MDLKLKLVEIFSRILDLVLFFGAYVAQRTSRALRASRAKLVFSKYGVCFLIYINIPIHARNQGRI